MIEIKNLCKSFITANGKLDALKNVTLTVNDGDIYGIIGMSGAGKSTLVRCVNMLERPTSGTVLIDGCDMGALSEAELRKKRRDMTMIFQNFNLLSQRVCFKNVLFPLELTGVKKSEAKKKVEELLELVGLSDKANAYPSQLSGGQQQRAAIARALATDPKILLCDEATSALDPATTRSILKLIRDINKKLGLTVIVITHQMSVVESICNRVAILDEGSVVEEGEVNDVFSAPKSAAAKTLVFPENFATEDSFSAVEGQTIIRIVFNGAKAASTPLISKMAMERNIAVNIMAASTKSIGDKAYGNMILSVPGGAERAKEAVEYLKSEPYITVEKAIVRP